MSTNYDLLNLSAHSNSEDSGKYFGLSIAMHFALVVGSLFVVAPEMQDLQKEVVTIELVSAETPVVLPMKTLTAPQGAKVAATSGSQPVLDAAPSAPIEAEEDLVVAGPVQKMKSSKAKAAQVKSHVSQGHAEVAKSAVSRVGVPETLEDIAAPELDMDGVEAAQVGNLGDNEFENEFKNIDKSNAAAIQAQQAELDAEAKLVADEKDAALQALVDDNSAKAKAMEDALKATRSKNAATLAQMKATERTAAEKAAREAQAAAAANQGSGANSVSEGRGNGDVGADKASTANAGEPNGVRSLEQLRQIPGNPKPQYSTEERLRRQNGSVIFYAFISKAGEPSQFRLVQSTGHRNLDGKTLSALKKWKFYPGQQGWVKIPFKWDLKGGVQEIPTALRRYGSTQ